jgi:beta-galactosidase
VDDSAAENINQYVKNGGTLLMSFFSGIVDEHEHIRLGGYPAPFREMLGLTVEEYVPYPVAQINSLRTTDGKPFTCSLWSDVIRLQTAQVLALYESDYFAGSPAVTRHQFDKGLGFYLGTELEPAGLDWLLGLVCAEAGILPAARNFPAGVEVLLRSNGEKNWLFLLNYASEKQEVSLENSGRDLLSGELVTDRIVLEPNGAAVIEF